MGYTTMWHPSHCEVPYCNVMLFFDHPEAEPTATVIKRCPKHKNHPESNPIKLGAIILEENREHSKQMINE